MVRGYFRIQIQIVLTAGKNLSVERAPDAKDNLQVGFYNFVVSERSTINLRSLQDLSASIVFRALGGDSVPTGGKLGSCSAACLPLAPQQRPPHETEGGGLELEGGC